ncbi:cytosine/adenosine deaminase-related metal-dependent hydrolase [Crossiella equi]|uniref:Cytosine/adenosine deaminase-related metal-dependent hydrolase n=1 Tax=Crossiella equi TaxID=130796 RepID=A0ABS5ALB8_9PSEU|nr:8-oxoguanine deaminase [Crossiella equi]MBP2477375.1 cytosine/adenosine deaminase-related metal-dependent hydrolase [Crossiella equi]
MSSLVIENAAIATVDADGTEHASGHVVVRDGRITAVGPGPAPAAEGERIDAHGCLVTPGLVNTHHHLYQWATRGLAQERTLFGWLVELYPIWGRLDAETTHAAASAGLAWLARTGCTTAADHHYVYPRTGGDQLDAVVSAATRVGIRLHAVRGSMDRGVSHGGLPPDHIVEDTDEALAATEAAVHRYHDRSPEAMVRIAVGPCSPFSVSERLMREAAELARRLDVRLHTHLAETLDEEEHCLAQYGCTPLDYAESLGWLGPDVWLAHGIHFSEQAIGKLGATRTGIAHCPTSNGRLGAGISPVRALLDAGSPVGLGVDGAASNEGGAMAEELRASLLWARQRGGPDALTARQALWLGTMGGARCLGREQELGSIEVGKQADLAVWRLSGLAHTGIADPVAALVFGTVPPLARLVVGGRSVVVDDELRTASEDELAGDLSSASRRLQSHVEVTL